MVYDFFAYLSAGTVIVALIDHVSGQPWLLSESLPPGGWALLVIFVYIAGHVVAHLSTLLFEHGLVQRLLGRPSVNLMGGRPKHRAAAVLCPGYYDPLPDATRRQVRDQMAVRGFPGEGEGMFLHALGIVAKEERAQKRLDEFRNVYSFARNMAFSLLAGAVALAVSALVRSMATDALSAAIFAGLGVIMLYRYLTFYRQYGYQLLLTYAELEKPEARAAGDDG
jgi:hypothetical protein